MRRDVDPLADHDPRRSAAQRSMLREARDFEHSAWKALGGHGCFFEWLLLETLHELVVETGDAASQVQLVERTGLTKGVVSYWMASMDDRGTIDREPALDGRAYRIYLSSDGRNTLRDYARRLDAAGLIPMTETASSELLEHLA